MVERLLIQILVAGGKERALKRTCEDNRVSQGYVDNFFPLFHRSL